MTRVCYHRFAGQVKYPSLPPFDPPAVFPELRFIHRGAEWIDRDNSVYPILRELLGGLGLHAGALGSEGWNPLGDLVPEGGSVVIKPNLVLHRHQKGDQGVFWIVCHPSVIRAMVDYALRAVGPSGRVSIADTPLENCDFDRLCDIIGLRKMVDSLRERGYGNLELLDLRTYQTTQFPDGSTVIRNLEGDPRGYTDIDLGRASLLQPLEDACGEQNYYTLGDHSVDHLDPRTKERGLPNNHHSKGRHTYRIPNTILESDLLVSLAKLKTHKFAGVTLCLKNAIGLSQGKEYLPHRRPGTPSENGDSFPSYPSKRFVGGLRLRRSVAAFLGGRRAEAVRALVRKVIPAKLPHELHTEPLWGDWYGNDTIWRTILDLNLVLFHADRLGLDLTRTKRRFLGVIDGIVGMDHEGPMPGLPVTANLLIAARDPVGADLVGTYLMGFDPGKIPSIMGASLALSPALGEVVLSRSEVKGNVAIEEARCAFVPTKGWKAHLADASPTFPFRRRE